MADDLARRFALELFSDCPGEATAFVVRLSRLAARYAEELPPDDRPAAEARLMTLAVNVVETQR